MTARLFFGMDTMCPWPERLPSDGRIISEENRHLTFVFLGDQNSEELIAALSDFPAPPCKVGFAGYFDASLELPPRHPRVIAWRANFGLKQSAFLTFQAEAAKWLNREEERGFTPHVTLCRHPRDLKKWQKAFHRLPVVSQTLHLFESLGYSRYRSLWNLSLLPPLVELKHTADIAFIVRGESLAELNWNAFIALALNFPGLLDFYREREIGNLDDIVIGLNEMVAAADSAVGTPYKAVSFHGEIKEVNQVLEWEMIIDV